MSGKKQLRLIDYKRQACLSENEPLGGCYAYCLDGHPDKREKQKNRYDMAEHVELPSCSCCDYFIVEKDGAISLIEITQFPDERNSMWENLKHHLRPKKREAFFSRYHIPTECILKMYGSMAVLGQFALRCSAEQGGGLVGGKYKFFLVFHGAKKHDTTAIRDIEKFLRARLKSVMSGFLTEVKVLRPKDLQGMIASNAVFP